MGGIEVGQLRHKLLGPVRGLLDRRDHLRPVEAALRDKALPADFRFPAMDLRLSLARLCAVDGRPD